jgi:E3 ubiquitin-protein ligase ZSWIM2
MSSRNGSFILKPPAAVVAMVAELMDEGRRMLLVQTVGPTVFIVKEDSSDTKYKVIVGSRQMCNCRQSCSESLCIHILFVMMKVLRVPRDNPVVWQLSLTDNEVDQALSGSLGRQRVEVRHAFMKRKEKRGGGEEKTEEELGVTRLQLQEDEVCPICLDPMKADEPLTYCKKQCGNNIHIECALEYAQHKVSCRDKITCPLCRVEWGSMAIYELRQAEKDFKSGKDKSGGCGGAESTTHKATCAVCQSSPIQVERVIERVC